MIPSLALLDLSNMLPFYYSLNVSVTLAYTLVFTKMPFLNKNLNRIYCSSTIHSFIYSLNQLSVY